ncbi:hypothetical protein D3C86_1332020 [compost metagenome]
MNQQRQVVEAPGLDAVDADPARARAQQLSCVKPRGCDRERAVALRLGQHQFAMTQEFACREHGRVDRRLERQCQRAARGARPARRRAQRAVQVEALARREDDGAAIARHRDRRRQTARPARARIEVRARARRIEQRARTDHDEGFGRLGQPGLLPIECATDADRAAVGHLPVGPPEVVVGHRGPRRGVEHGALADPHQPGLARTARLPTAGQSAALHADGAARRAQQAVDRDLPAAQADGLTRIDRDLRTRAHIDRRPRHRGHAVVHERLQLQARAAALREHAAHRVFGPQRRHPQRECALGLAAACDGLRIGRKAVDRHAHIELRAIGHDQPEVSVDVVAREA